MLIKMKIGRMRREGEGDWKMRMHAVGLGFELFWVWGSLPT